MLVAAPGRTVRFLPAVYVALEEYNNCLPNNKCSPSNHTVYSPLKIFCKVDFLTGSYDGLSKH